MMRQPVTASLLHRLVVGSHAEGTTRIAVAVLIEDHQRILLVEINNSDDAFNYSWEAPSDVVLPGEPLDDAVHRTAAAAGIDLGHIVGYLGHHDRPVSDDIVRTFVFAATPAPGHDCRHTARNPYRWVAIDDLPDRLDGETLDCFHLAGAPLDPDNPDRPQRLSAALRTHARGLLAAEAAIELLIGHRCWLRRLDFIDSYIATGPGLANATPLAWVDWPAAITALDTAALPCTSSEARMLRIAASLAEGIPLDLQDALTGLDNHNLDLVITAVLHTGQ